MKKLLLALFLGSSSLFAQTFTNGGLETWSTVFGSSAEEPNGWLTANLATSTFVQDPNTNPVSVTKVTDVVEGTFACRLETVTLNYNPNPDYIPSTGGVAFMGTMEVSFTPAVVVKIKPGFPVTNFDPVSVSFDAKYAPISTDSGLVNVFLTHWNGTSRDTIALGIQKFLSAVPTYTNYVLPITYKPAFTGVNADTCMLGFASSDPEGNPQVGSAIYLDNFVFMLPAGTKAALSNDGFMLYPNPSKDKFAIQSTNGTPIHSVAIYSSDGKLMQQETVSDNSISIENLPEGIYQLQLFTRNMEHVATKKLSVSK